MAMMRREMGMGIGFGGGAMRWLGLGLMEIPDGASDGGGSRRNTRSLDCICVPFADAHFARDDNEAKNKGNEMVTKVRREAHLAWVPTGVCYTDPDALYGLLVMRWSRWTRSISAYPARR